MSVHVVLASESFIANLASVILLSRVSFRVSFHPLTSVRFEAANFANYLLVRLALVNESVLDERALAGESGA